MARALNYTGVFFEDNTHMTWNYGFPLVYPEGVFPDDDAEVKVVGKYEDDDVACLIVEYGEYTQQSSGTFLHITTKAINGVSPVHSGLRATANGYESITPYVIKGIWK